MALFNYKHQSEKEYYEGPDGIQQSGDELYGDYQFTSLADVISGFTIAYVGEDKIINRIKRPDVIWHAKRALQELSFDTFKSCKSQEIEIPSSLTMPLPHDYVNYVKLTWSDSAGIEHIIYPTSKTSNPFAISQETNGDYKFGNTSTCFDEIAEIVTETIATPGTGPGLEVQGALQTMECKRCNFSLQQVVTHTFTVPASWPTATVANCASVAGAGWFEMSAPDPCTAIGGGGTSPGGPASAGAVTGGTTTGGAAVAGTGTGTGLGTTSQQLGGGSTTTTSGAAASAAATGGSFGYGYGSIISTTPVLKFAVDPRTLGIIVGMQITGIGINGFATVIDIDSTNKTITLDETPTWMGGPDPSSPNWSISFTFCPVSVNANLLPQYEEIIKLTDITYSLGTNLLEDNANSTTEVTVGMRIISHDFPTGTYVTEIQNGNEIKLSKAATGTSHTTSTDIAYFVTLNIVSDTWDAYKSTTPSENQDDYQDDTYWPAMGERYGLDPQHAQANGSFFIDCNSGKIHFSSNISGKTIILEYLSDSLGTDKEMKVHKFAEEAMYKWIAHGILATRSNMPEYIVARFKKEKFAETRKAKLRLSNIKLEEITQMFRGKSKQIKH